MHRSLSVLCPRASRHSAHVCIALRRNAHCAVARCGRSASSSFAPRLINVNLTLMSPPIMLNVCTHEFEI